MSYEDYCRIQSIESSDHLFVVGIERASSVDECCGDDGAPGETIWISLNADHTIDPAHGWFTTEQEVRHLNFSRRFTVWEDWEASSERSEGASFEAYRDARVAGALGVMGVSQGAVRMSELACPVCGDRAQEDEDPEEREMVDQWWAATRNPDGSLRSLGPVDQDRSDPDQDEAQFLADAQL